jgi:hypothetical protein
VDKTRGTKLGRMQIYSSINPLGGHVIFSKMGVVVFWGLKLEHVLNILLPCTMWKSVTHHFFKPKKIATKNTTI